MKSILNIIKFSFLQGARKKSFIVSTVIVVLVLLVFMNFNSLTSLFKNITGGSDKNNPQENTAIENNIYLFNDTTGNIIPDTDVLNVILPGKWKYGTENDIEPIKQKIKNNEIKMAVIIAVNSENIYTADVYSLRMSMFQDMSGLFSYIENLYKENIYREIGVRDTDIARLESKIVTNITELSEKNMTNAYLPVYIMMFILYITIIMYGSVIVSSVASEKGTRIMELLITSARPSHLMFGKIIGYGLIGLMQLLIIIGTGILCVVLNPNGAIINANINLDLSKIPVNVYICFSIFYLTGYYIYAGINAAAGSLVSRLEDANSTMMPIMFLTMISFFASFFSMTDPESTFCLVLSFIPFTSPMTMLLRVAATDVPFYQIAICILLQLLTIAGLSWLSAKIYRLGVLLYGKTPSVKEIFRALKEYKV